jgi:hypothetical protein
MQEVIFFQLSCCVYFHNVTLGNNNMSLLRMLPLRKQGPEICFCMKHLSMKALLPVKCVYFKK